MFNVRTDRQLRQYEQDFYWWADEVDWDKWEEEAIERHKEQDKWGGVDDETVDLFLRRKENKYSSRVRKHILRSLRQWKELQNIWRKRQKFDRYLRMVDFAHVTIKRSRGNITFKNLKEYDPDNVLYTFKKMGRLLINEMLRRLYLVKIKLGI